MNSTKHTSHLQRSNAVNSEIASETHCSKTLEELKPQLISDYSVQLTDNYECSYHKSINKLGPFWDALAADEILMSSQYLQVLELHQMEGIQPYYGIIHRGEDPIGIIYWQLKDFDLSESLDIHSHSDSALSRIWVKVKQFASRLIKDNLLVVGNVSLTGDFGFRFCPSVSQKDQKMLVDKASLEFIELKKASGTKIKTIMVKDFRSEEGSNRFERVDYTPYVADPTMLLDIRWDSFDDYLAEHKSKARVRVKRAKKLGAELKMKQLTIDEIIENQVKIFELYKKIASYSSFNLFTLNENYFVDLKLALKEHFQVYAVYYEDNFVAFFSTIVNKDVMHGHFLGYDQAFNAKTQLYLNILYWLVELAIDQKVGELELSRTALEIKSSIGAEPLELAVMVKAKNSLFNSLMKRVVPIFLPENKWQARSPFKQAN